MAMVISDKHLNPILSLRTANGPEPPHVAYLNIWTLFPLLPLTLSCGTRADGVSSKEIIKETDRHKKNDKRDKQVQTKW